MFLEVVLEYGRDGSRKGQGALSGGGLWFAGHPPTADATDRAFDTYPATGQDVGPAKRGGFTEPQTAEARTSSNAR
jgi:hypothetical protein